MKSSTSTVSYDEKRTFEMGSFVFGAGAIRGSALTETAPASAASPAGAAAAESAAGAFPSLLRRLALGLAAKGAGGAAAAASAVALAPKRPPEDGF